MQQGASLASAHKASRGLRIQQRVAASRCCALGMQAAICTNEDRYPNISRKIDSKHEEDKETEADPQRTPNAEKTKEAHQTRAERNRRATSAYTGASGLSKYSYATSAPTNFYKENT